MNLGAVMNPDQAQIHGPLQLRFTAHPQYGNSWRRQVGGSQACRRGWWGEGGERSICPCLTFPTSAEELAELHRPTTPER